MRGVHSGLSYGESEVMKEGSGRRQGIYKRITEIRSVVYLGLSMQEKLPSVWANYLLCESIQELLLRKIHHFLLSELAK